MNKKFSTLVASILLAGSLGANAQINLAAPGCNGDLVDVEAYDPSTKLGGYQVGMSYALKDATNGCLAIDENGCLTLITTAISSLDQAKTALWTLQSIDAPAGAVAPKYVFVNNATNQTLALNPGAAVALANVDNVTTNVKVGGSQTEWLNAPSYTNPTDAPLYAALANDQVVALVKNTTGKVVLAKMSKTELTNALQFMPQEYDDYAFVLSANELNTMLGAAGQTATADSYFSFNFDPKATVMGEDNLWTQDLQAVAVTQSEIKYGTESESVEGAFATLHPETLDKENVSFQNPDPQYLALKNRDNKYLVVDTASIDGTGQTANLRMSFAMDGLFNAKNGTRYRNPKSYLFAVLYNPSTKAIQIQTKGYYDTPAIRPASDDFNPTTYYTSYAAQAELKGSVWTGATEETTDVTIIKAALGKTTEVTVGVVETTPNNEFVIKLGVSSEYQLTHLNSGAYLVKVVASDKAERVGKYWVNNLKGGFEIMEQATRQNFQDMPAAQWIVSSTGTIDGSPVSILNREFEGTPDATVSGTASGMVYRKASYPANTVCFGPGQDVLQFIPVTKVADKYLGYKYVANDTISESLFTFNYLHDLAMDKPINTKNDVDSVVWVDKDGNSTKFVLEAVFDDSYGTNRGITSIAGLTRRVYKVKVNDATKLQNDKRYLAYDNKQKKYVVSSGNGDLFFLKENNEVTDGECYYALVKANVAPIVTLNDAKNAVASRNGQVVLDNDITGFYGEKGKYMNQSTGLFDEGLVINVYDTEADAEAEIAKLPEGFVAQKLGTDVTINVTDQKTLADANIDYTAGKYVIAYVRDNSHYSTYKVSVDNNTLDLVNGVLNNEAAKEVATSAFAVVRDADPLYRRFNVAELGEKEGDAINILKFFRINATSKEYLYEDANSKYSADKKFDFLGVEGKGDSKNAAFYVDTAYVDRGTKMPQYMLALRPDVVVGDTVLCDATTHSHATVEEALKCEHTKITPSYVDATYLINLQDSVDAHTGAEKAKYQWNNNYTRLGFVEARHIGDTLVIKNTNDSIRLDNNLHKNVVFSFRLLKSGSNDFLIESETEKDGKNIKNAKLDAVKIAPMNGGWVKIQNGVPVIANMTYTEAGLDAEIFNVETTDEKPTANEGVEVSEVSIVAVNGAVIVKGAAGKNVVITNVLGKQIANETVSSDNATFAAPAGVVIVAVEGEEAVKVAVK